MDPIFKKTLKIFAWVLGSILFLMALVLILIQLPAIQNFAKNKAVAYLENKIKTKVVIDNLSISFPKEVVLKGVYFEDQTKDTLLYAKEIKVDIALFKLINHEVNVNYFELTGIKTHIHRLSPDTAFNFDYIIKAFSSGKKTANPADTTGGMKFSLNQIRFKDILATFKDDNSGNNVYFYLGDFESKIKIFNPDKLVFTISNIRMSGVNARVHQYIPIPAILANHKENTKDNSSLVPNPSIRLDELSLQNIQFIYLNDISALQADLKVGELITHPKSLNLQNLYIGLNDLSLKNTIAKVTINKKTTGKQSAKTRNSDTVNSPSWNIKVNNLALHNEEISYNDNNFTPVKAGMDYSHLHIKGLQFSATDLDLNPSAYKGSIRQLTFKEQSGFSVQNLQTHFYYSDTAAHLQNLYLKTGKTLLKDNISVQYPSLKSIAEHIGNIYVNATLKNSTIDIRDVLTFAPQLSKMLQGNENKVLHINTRILGLVKNISIPQLQVSGIGKTYINISGKIKGLPDAKNSFYNLNIIQLTTTAADINALVPPSSLPSNLRLPQYLTAKGYFKGSIKKLETQLQLNSSSGNVSVKGSMYNSKYAINVTLHNLNVGYLTKQEKDIGVVSVIAQANGNGFTLKKAVADVTANIQSAEWKGYAYKNLVLAAHTNQGIAELKAGMQDANINFDLTAHSDLTTPYPSNFKMQLQVDTLNLNALHLRKDTMNVSGYFAADLVSTNPDSLIGKIFSKDVSFTTTQKTIYPDSIAITATAIGLQRSLLIASPFLKADLTGQYRLTQMSQALQQTIQKYYPMAGYHQKTIQAEDWQLNATVIPTSFILQIISGIKGSDSIAIHTDFKSNSHDLNASIKTKKIIYNGNQADSVNVLLKTVKDRLNFSASLENIKGQIVSTYHTSLEGFIANNKVNLALIVNDKKNKPQYTISGILQQITKGFNFTLQQDGLVLNYDKWAVAQDNFIHYDSSGIIFNNFNISNFNQLLSLHSDSKTADAPLHIKFNNFQISTLTRIANQDSLLLGGSINGNAVVKNFTTHPVFTSDLTINNVVYEKDSLGTFTLKINNEQATAFAADISIKGNNNDVNLKGNYHTGEGQMDLKLIVNSLNLASIKPFTGGQLLDAGGIVKSDLSITGTLAKPVVNGNFNFVNAFIVPTLSGERFNLSNQSLHINEQGIHLNNFTLLDSSGNKAILSGDILTNDFRKYRFNANLNARNFTVVNSPKTPNRLFYGKLNMNVRVKLSGDMDSPQADATIHINAATNFTMLLPTNNPEIQERKGIVNFTDKHHPADTLSKKTIYDSLATSSLRGIDVSANIETDSASKLTLIIDEGTGDALTVQGSAHLNGGIDKSGKISLTGNYQLTRGIYQVSLSILKRKFEIQPGSSITWTGDPTLAQVDINAIYYAKTAPIDLVQQQLGSSQQDLTRFKQPLPFQVGLKLQGDLLKPSITFNITLPQNLLSQWPEVDLKLQQMRTDESELNKQVFALLLLNRFVQDDPFASSAGRTSVSDIGINSAGRILGEQLNNLAGSLVKGVDINFDINSAQDYSSGTQQTRTDVNVTVSKKLLNDRLIVNVGSDVGLQGAANNATSVQNSSLSGNFSADYKISKDGRYRLRAYRQNDYQEIIEGQVIETGVSFILIMDYDHFSELFKRKKRNSPKSGNLKVETQNNSSKTNTEPVKKTEQDNQ